MIGRRESRFVVFALCAWCALLGWCAPPAFADPIKLPTPPAERPRLKSIYCGEHDLTELTAPNVKAILLVFLEVDCPVAQSYLPTLNALHAKFGEQGVRIYGLFPNPRVHIQKMAAFALENDLPFPVFFDKEQRLARALQVTTTPEAVLLDGDLNRHYQGAIDDQFTKRGRKEEATEHYLRDAIEAVLAGKTVERPNMPPSGCPLEQLGEPESDKKFTYYRDVAPIVQRSCQACHRPGGVGPFSLLTYDDAYFSASRIQEAVAERRMPPWHGFLNPKFGNLKHAQNLSDEEIETLSGWVAQGAPRGDASDAPAPVKWPNPDEWSIGKPDLVYQIPKPFTVPKHGIVDYQFFTVKLNFPEDRWFRAVEVKPGNTSVVHHIGLHLVKSENREYKGFAAMAALYGLNSEAARLINDYVPGDYYNAKIYPGHQAVRIPKGSDLVFEVHYTPNNRAAVNDQSMVAFQWASEPPAEEVLTKVYRKPVGRFRIPAESPHHTMTDTFYFEKDVYIDAVRPHFHYRGKSFKLEVVQRSPETDEVTGRETILSAPVFDPDWQRTYELETPLFMPAGTEMVATGYFDNSKFNPRNPNPKAIVQWGQQSYDEMFSVRFKYHAAESSSNKR